MNKTYDAIVVGAGSVGMPTAMALGATGRAHPRHRHAPVARARAKTSTPSAGCGPPIRPPARS
ncbi:MAG: hypothetical protein MZV70_08835 [Desulfobacterales bacterium]|nr:hypothetical protein [Desulfobacterales bacterium]